MVYKSPFPPVPVSNESLPKKLLNAIWRHGKIHPTMKALITADDPTKYIAFHELHTSAHRVRAFLRASGFREGDVTCLILGNCIEWAVFQLGAMAAGGVVTGASDHFTDYELERHFLDSRCTIVLTDEKNLHKVQKAVEKCGTIKTIVCLRRNVLDGSPLPSNIVEWSQVVACYPDYDIPDVDPGSMVVLPYSSGTTGPPKGVMLSHRNVGSYIDVAIDHFNREIIGVIGPKDHSWYNETLIVNLPFYHMSGFGKLNINIFAGSTTVVMAGFDTQLFLSCIEKYRPRILYTVPLIVIFLAKHPAVEKFDCSSIEIVIVGTAPTGKDICMQFLARHTNVKHLCHGYGMTECTVASHLPVLNVKDEYLGVGRAVSNAEQKIVDVEPSKEVGVGERGEVWVRSPTVMIGYLNRPEATAETIDKDGWLHTGDIGYMDEDGRMYIVDRLKELIKVKGFQVAPAELEGILLSHPQIRDAAVIGIPDTRMGELIRACVVRASDILTEDDVVKFVAKKVASYKQITGGVKFVDAVPKSASGKILRRFLRDKVSKETKAKIMVYKSPFPPVPVSNESLPKKLLNAIWKHGQIHPTKHCLITAADPAKSLTFHEVHNLAHRVRAFLRVRGFSTGYVACLVLSNCIEWAVFQLGAMAAGGAVSGASALFTDYELERQFLDSGCTVILTDEDHLGKVLKAVSKCETVKTIVCLRSNSSEGSHLPHHIVQWAEVVSCQPDYDIPDVDPGSMVVLPYSSGTTGSPKGVMLSHRNVGSYIDILIDHFTRELYGVIGPKNHSWHNETFIVNLPFYHMLGFGRMNMSLFAGATSIVMAGFDPELFLSSIQKYRPRTLSTVPPILIFLAKHPMVELFDCSSLEVVTVGAAPTGKDICMQFLARHKNVKHLCQGYGMTECTVATHLSVLNVKDEYMGVGKPASNVEQKIVDVVTGKEVGVGEKGELWVRGPTVMMGYLNQPEATAETVDKDGWLHTGDIGYMDEDGRTYIVDRLKELIKVKGLQVAPAELEDLLLSHPQIRDAAVIGIPDTRMGELVRAYVVRANEELTEDVVIKFVAQKVASYKQITGGVKFVEEVPKSPSGKILRRFLRDEVTKETKAKM